MTRLSLLLFCIVILLVSACSPTRLETPEAKTITPLVLPTSLPTAISTLVPQTTENAATAYPASTATAQPMPSPTGNSYPAGQAVFAANPTATVGSAPAGPTPTPGPAAAPFKDCARTPGLVDCAANAVPLKARLAFVDVSTGRLVGLDLETGQGWQAPLASGPASSLGGLDWSPGPVGASGPQLLAAPGNNQYDVFSASGQLLETFTSEQAPAWQPGGTLSRDGSVRSAAGDDAHLEQTADMHWQLHVKPAQGEETTLPIESNPSDILYILRAWVPGTQRILGQSYFAGNQAMTQGGQLLTIDTAGVIQQWDARMSLAGSPSAGLNFAWDPAQQQQLAFLETGDTGVMSPRLALLNVQAGSLVYPLSDGVTVNGLAWLPDGRLSFAASQINFANPPQQAQYFHGPGIYVVELKAMKIDMLVQTPQSATDGWPQWTADGQVMVYARAISAQAQASGGLAVQVRAHRLSDGRDWVLVEGLVDPESTLEPGSAQRLLAFSPK